MSPRDSLVNFYRESNPAHPPGYAFNFAAAILAIPEMQRLVNFREATYLKHAEHRHKSMEDCPTWHDGCNCIIPHDEFDNEDFKRVLEMKENTEKWHALDGAFAFLGADNPLGSVLILDIADIITQWREKAEQFDALFGGSKLKEILEKAGQLDLLMHSKRVKEKCYQCERGYPECSLCHGTGLTERPATFEEMREGIELAFKFRDSDWVHDPVNHTWGFKLGSGVILITKEEE